MHLVCGADHAGNTLLTALMSKLKGSGYLCSFHGAATPDTQIDYPQVASQVCADLAAEHTAMGILVCGSGVGMSMMANRCGQRAALCFHEYTAEVARAHNDARILCLGARLLALELAQRIVTVFLTTPFAADRHSKRVAQIENLCQNQ